MAEYLFQGNVSPTPLPFNVELEGLKREIDGGVNVSMKLRFSNEGHCEVTCSTDADIEAPLSLYKLAVDSAQYVLDVLTLSNRKHYSLSIRKMRHGKEVADLELEAPAMPDFVTAFEGEAGFRDVTKLIFNNRNLALAVSDLCATTPLSRVAVVNCARAIEGARHVVAPELVGGRKTSWANFRARLNLSEAYLRYVTERSEKPRHGDWGHVVDADNRECVVRAWTIVHRCIAFLLRGGQAVLPEDRYPTL